jgi:hypothetical protein
LACSKLFSNYATSFVAKPVGFQEFFEAIQDIGVFGAVHNEPPPRGVT